MMSKSSILSSLAAIFGASCCGIPVVFALVGLGGLGMGSFLGKYHWYLTITGIILLVVAWIMFARERKKCDIDLTQPEISATKRFIRTTKATGGILGGSTLIVVLFLGMNIYGQITSRSQAALAVGQVPGSVTKVIPVEGMVCVACEILVEESLTKLDGVLSAQASERHGNVVVQYISEKVTLVMMGEAIKGSGYKAILEETTTEVQ